MTERRPRHEADTLAVRPVVVVLIITAVAVPLSALVLWLALQALSPPPALEVGPAPPEIPPDLPTLQTNPPADYARYQEALTRRLNSLGWVNREAGIVHIPIEEAMTQLLAQGLSDSASGAAPAPDSERGGSAP